MQIKAAHLFIFICTLSCKEKANSKSKQADFNSKPIQPTKKSTTALQILDIPLPEGYSRQQNTENSFADWLQQIVLKKDNTVFYYNGEVKPNQQAQYAVLDISVGKQNLQQCADAVMRLRAEYLFYTKQYSTIVFFDNDKKRYAFEMPYTEENLAIYLKKVFGMCGTASLSKQMQKITYNQVQAGDVLIRGGFPGHAVIVMDVAVNEDGKKIFLLAQSYMPAQDVHVLKNPMVDDISPWYFLNDAEYINTPEYTFNRNEWKTW